MKHHQPLVWIVVGLYLSGCHSTQLVGLREIAARRGKLQDLVRGASKVWVRAENRISWTLVPDPVFEPGPIVGLDAGGKSVRIPISDVRDARRAGRTALVVVTKAGAKRRLETFEFTGHLRSRRTGQSYRLGEITGLKLEKFSAGKTVAVVLGTLGATALVVVILAAAACSCPSVYVFDGKTYVHCGEIFPGAVVKSAETGDLLLIGAARPAARRYRLLLANEEPELQYTDELRLLAVDHPPGTRVLPSSNGEVHLVGEPLAPVEAVDGAGRSVLGEISAADDVLWGSRADDPVPPGNGPVLDRVVLTFPRPRGATAAKLVFRGRNTVLSTLATVRYLEQFDNSKALMEFLGSLPNTRAAFRGTKIKEGAYLTVKVHTGRGWETRTYLPDVGKTFRELVVPIDLSRVEGNTVKIALSGARLFWEIDRVGIDYSRQLAPTPIPLRTLSARDRRGQDLRVLLEKRDGRYYASKQGDEAEIEFEAPPADPARRRTLLLRSAGYYHLLLRPQPNAKPLLQMLTNREPVSRFALRFLRDLKLKALLALSRR